MIRRSKQLAAGKAQGGDSRALGKHNSLDLLPWSSRLNPHAYYSHSCLLRTTALDFDSSTVFKEKAQPTTGTLPVSHSPQQEPSLYSSAAPKGAYKPHCSNTVSARAARRRVVTTV